MSMTTLDPRGVRFTASITCVLLALGLITTSWRVMAAQAALFALCAFVGMRLNPWGYLYRRTVQPKLQGISPAEREAAGPVRFAQGVGFVFAVVATVCYAAGWTTPGLVANALALVAALLNAVFGYCLGCQLYLVLRRFSPAGVSTSDTR